VQADDGCVQLLAEPQRIKRCGAGLLGAIDADQDGLDHLKRSVSLRRARQQATTRVSMNPEIDDLRGRRHRPAAFCFKQPTGIYNLRGVG
jgi:hypothetical protein